MKFKFKIFVKLIGLKECIIGRKEEKKWKMKE